MWLWYIFHIILNDLLVIHSTSVISYNALALPSDRGYRQKKPLLIVGILVCTEVNDPAMLIAAETSHCNICSPRPKVLLPKQHPAALAMLLMGRYPALCLEYFVAVQACCASASAVLRYMKYMKCMKIWELACKNCESEMNNRRMFFLPRHLFWWSHGVKTMRASACCASAAAVLRYMKYMKMRISVQKLRERNE